MHVSQRQRGVSLIEVLIAVLVLAIGLLGIAGLQTASLTTNNISYQYSQAATLAQSMAERMRANQTGVYAGSYTLAAGTPPTVATNCASANCNSASQAAWDMGVLYSQVTGSTVSNAPKLSPTDSSGAQLQALPLGNASIACPSPFPTDGTGTCVITIYWDASRTSSASNFTCSTTDSTALRCFRLAFQPQP